MFSAFFLTLTTLCTYLSSYFINTIISIKTICYTDFSILSLLPNLIIYNVLYDGEREDKCLVWYEDVLFESYIQISFSKIFIIIFFNLLFNFCFILHTFLLFSSFLFIFLFFLYFFIFYSTILFFYQKHLFKNKNYFSNIAYKTPLKILLKSPTNSFFFFTLKSLLLLYLHFYVILIEEYIFFSQSIWLKKKKKIRA